MRQDTEPGWLARRPRPSKGVDPVALQAYIDKVVADWPPLTNEQRDRLALLLRPQPEKYPAPDHTFGSLTASLVDQMVEDGE